jgi:hypothetical protein
VVRAAAVAIARGILHLNLKFEMVFPSRHHLRKLRGEVSQATVLIERLVFT